MLRWILLGTISAGPPLAFDLLHLKGGNHTIERPFSGRVELIKERSSPVMALRPSPSSP
jgi:hypothetical protein